MMMEGVIYAFVGIMMICTFCTLVIAVHALKQLQEDNILLAYRCALLDNVIRRISEASENTKVYCGVDVDPECAVLVEKVRAQRLNYNELLYQVSYKHPNETRHQTALRYIKQSENKNNMPEKSARAKGE
jgi:hypothetical protein